MNPPGRFVFFPRGLEVESVQNYKEDSSSEDVNCHGNVLFPMDFGPVIAALFFWHDLGVVQSLGMLVVKLLGDFPLTRLI